MSTAPFSHPPCALCDSSQSLACICIYRLYFHPLAKYPGPLLGRLTSLYGGYHAYVGDLHLDMWRLHQKYGDVVRYAPNRLLINTNTALREIYSHSKHLSKAKGYKAMWHRAPNTLTTIDKLSHIKKRRIMSQGFSDKAMKMYEPRILRHVTKFCQTIEHLIRKDNLAKPDSSGWTKPMVMSDWCGWMVFDIMTDVIFEEHFQLLERDNYRYILPSLERTAVRTGVLCQVPKMKQIPKRIDYRFFAEAIRCRNRYIQFVSQLMTQRMSTGSKQRDDIFSIMLNTKDASCGQPLTLNDIAAESTTLIVAGSDTTATSLAATFFYLARYPEAYARVTNEVRSSFGSSSEIHLGPALGSCVFLRACIDEAMRMSPPVGSALWREVSNGGAIEIDGQVVCEGADVGTCIYSIHHHHDYYPDPFVYRPERWLVRKDAEMDSDLQSAHQVALALSAFNPFSLGPRSCVGKGLAMNEMVLAMAMILLEYDFRTVDGPLGCAGEGGPDQAWGRHRKDEYQLRDFVTGAKYGPVVQFKRRICT